MKNIFKFYTGKEYNKDTIKATKEILLLINNFEVEMGRILDKYCYIGATDTQSREEIIKYLKKELERGGFI